MENQLLVTSVKAAIEAGLEILKIYNTDFDIEYKDDKSPLTIADKKAHNIISSYLEKTDIPILSEEGRAIPFSERSTWKKLWIVDPLDGTKEFIKKNDEFTVNIALVEDHSPIMGVIYAPVLDIVYYGEKGNGSFKVSEASSYFNNIEELFKNSNPLPMVTTRDYFGVVASRSHMSDETQAFIDDLNHENIKIVSKGSSLKLCMVAEGEAEIYPRFAPTSEWDTAAGHAIVSAMGGKVVKAKNPDENVIYNKEDILNPWFIVYAPGIDV
jgi:3'(2'), 5'-bisphosphate nucleotidase